MGLYDKEKDGKAMIDRSEYRTLIRKEDRIEHLYRRRCQILEENAKDKARGYDITPTISIAEIDIIFDFAEEMIPFKPTKDDLRDAVDDGYME